MFRRFMLSLIAIVTVAIPSFVVTSPASAATPGGCAEGYSCQLYSPLYALAMQIPPIFYWIAVVLLVTGFVLVASLVCSAVRQALRSS
jgi:hypothetical protein